MSVLSLAFDFALFTGGFELFVACREDSGVVFCIPVGGSDVAGFGVKADMVVMVDEVGNDAFGILQAKWCFGPDGLLLEPLSVRWCRSSLPLDEKFDAFGFEVREVNGNDIGELVRIFDSFPLRQGRPNLVLAKTLKGRGISCMENNAKWHHHVRSEEE